MIRGFRAGWFCVAGLLGICAKVDAVPPPPDDDIPPVLSGPLTAEAVSGSQINLRWPAGTDNRGIQHYVISRCIGGLPCSYFTEIATVGTTTLSYSDTGLASGATYSYSVAAYDFALNDSNPIIASATTFDTTPPSIPAAINATAVSGTRIDVSWSAATDNIGVTGYLVERCQGAGCSNFSWIATPSGTIYSSTGLMPATTYRFRVRAQDAVPNYGDYSPVGSATTQDTVAPDGVKTTAGELVIGAICGAMGGCAEAE